MSLEKEDLKSSLFKYEIAVFPLFSHHLFHNIGNPSLPENSEEIRMFSGWGKKRGFFANHARCISVKKLHANSKYWILGVPQKYRKFGFLLKILSVEIFHFN